MKNKKTIIWSLIAAALITAAGMAVNYMYYQKNGHLLLCLRMFGGEITVEQGFGLKMTHIYSMLQGQKDMVSLSFNWIGCLASFLLIFLIMYVLSILGTSLLKRKKA